MTDQKTFLAITEKAEEAVASLEKLSEQHLMPEHWEKIATALRRLSEIKGYVQALRENELHDLARS